MRKSRATILIEIVLVLVLMLVAFIAAPGSVRIRGAIAYSDQDDPERVYDVLQPVENNGAAILFVQSGAGRSSRIPPLILRFLFADIFDAGFTVVVLHHSNAGSTADHFLDLKRAVRHVRINAAGYGIDGNRIGVTGSSGGGHLALLLGVNSDAGNARSEDAVERTASRVGAVVAFFPPVDWHAFMELRRQIARREGGEGPSEQSLAAAADISPNLFVDSQDPPTLLFHGDVDPIVPISHSELMYAALREHDVPAEFVAIPGAGHGIGLGAVFDNSGHPLLREDTDTVGEAMLDWFDRYLSAGSVGR